MTHDSLMPIGKNKGTPLARVHDSYWQWFIRQEWAEHWTELLAYCEKRLGKKFNPVRKKRECVLTVYPKWVGNPEAANFNDGECPFDV